MNRSTRLDDLSLIQGWLQSVIMHPEGVATGIDAPSSRVFLDISSEQVEAVVCPSTRQTSIDRLQVYAHAYYARLLEVLSSEFSALAHALGAELFQDFALDYLQQYPSQSYTLSNLGTRFSDYLALSRPPRIEGASEPDWADFLIDLARLERAYSEVFDGPGVEGSRLLEADDLRGLEPDSLMGLRLVPVPCLRLMTFRFPVHEYASAVRRQEHPPLASPSPTWLAITRRDYIVRRAPLEQAEFAALSVLVGGGTIADSLNAAESCWSGEFDRLAEEVQRWFRDWSTAGYFQTLIAVDQLNPST